MIKMKQPLAVKILFAILLASVLVWPLVAAAQTDPFFAPLRAGQLTGMKVEDTDGGKVGAVRNLIVDVKSGELKYVVIGSGGFLGVRATSRVAPSEAVSAATTKSQTLAISVSTPQWRNAPVFKSANIATLAEPNQEQEISRYFKIDHTHHSNEVVHSLSITGDNTGQHARRPDRELRFVSDLIGMRVVDEKQERVGEVVDLLVRLGPPQPSFVILSSRRFFHHGNQFAVPLSALNDSSKSGKLTLPGPAAMLQDAPSFDQQAWDSGGTNLIYRYSKADE